MKVEVEFKDVGRNDVNDKFVVEGNESMINSQIYQRLTRYLMSSEIAFDAVLNGDWGIVMAGFRNVGKLRIKEIKK